MTAAMAELRWSKNDIAPLTFRELFLIYQNALESRWNFQSAVLSEIHNNTVVAIRINSKEKPKMTTPADFNPCNPKGDGSTKINAQNFKNTCLRLGDQFLKMYRK